MDQAKLYRDFGNLLRGYRRRLGLTQESLAEDVGLSRTSITNIERGEQRILLHQLYSLADKLRVSPENLLPDLHSRDLEIDRKLGALPVRIRESVLEIVRSQEDEEK
jgi:transcriptional regulator with XRE-family HTH domain